MQHAFQRGLGTVKYIKKGFDISNSEKLDQIETATVRIQLFNERLKEVRGEWAEAHTAAERERLEAIFWELKGKSYLTYQTKQQAIIEFLESEPLVRQVVNRFAESYSTSRDSLPRSTKTNLLLQAFGMLSEDEKYMLVQNEYPDPVASAEGFMCLKERFDVAPEAVQLKPLY